ncbi:unnamed protein product [Linum trigynum]|uniref:Uncharacterized protein n=1 Tax=Linum trigynum TaxID=586398 RepID=A0AAV2FP39_9ROSI
MNQNLDFITQFDSHHHHSSVHPSFPQRTTLNLIIIIQIQQTSKPKTLKRPHHSRQRDSTYFVKFMFEVSRLYTVVACSPHPAQESSSSSASDRHQLHHVLVPV